MTDSRYEYHGSRSHQELIGRKRQSINDEDLPHRRMISGLLGPKPASRTGIAAVLGAGQCRDVDLRDWLERFHEVHLIDFDRQAMEAGTQAQQVTAHPRLFLHAERDIGGFRALLDSESDAETISRDEIDDAVLSEAIRGVSLSELGTFDVVLSANALAVEARRLAAGVNRTSTTAAALMGTLRQHHLEMMVDLTRPGGVALLVTELTNSQFVPVLRTMPDEAQLDALLRQPEILPALNPGCNPGAVDAAIQNLPSIRTRLHQYDFSRPWLREAEGVVSAYLAYRMIRPLAGG